MKTVSQLVSLIFEKPATVTLSSLSTLILDEPSCTHIHFNFCLCEYQGRLKLTVLSEDRLQMKWKEADGPVQGYKVRVRPISGETSLHVFTC